MELCKVDFWCQQIIHSVQYRYCCEHITGGVYIYFYGCVSLLAPLYAVCFCLCIYVCLISKQSAVPNLDSFYEVSFSRGCSASINLPYSQAWNTVAMSGLVLQVATSNCLLQKWACRTIPLAHCQNVVSLSLFYRYYFGRCSSELAELVLLSCSWGRSTHYSDRLHDFSITIPRCYIDVYVNSFFPCTNKLWNSLPIECFPFTYDLSDFKSLINIHLLTVGSF